ncbi:hypothetical protein [Streptomyces sp. NPDC097610]|uniref:hypothetical protein n=1 Tax=Streptomyces sp. NPDC097610 TaxID=3157227 RepID=UPI003328D1F7
MVSVTHAAHHIEVTAESLQEDLARLEVQKQALERELAAVVTHLGSVQRALSALQILMPPAGSSSSDAAATTPAPGPSVVDPAVPTAAPQDQGVAPESSEVTGEQNKYGKLTEQILDYFSGAGDTDIRARDVAAALGRATDSGSINAVRSTLDRLVGTARIRRTGRGLYRAA